MRLEEAPRPSRRDLTIEIRPCEGLDELRACVGLQKQVWGYSDADLVPLRMLVVAQSIGGQVIAAFSRGEMVGFACSIPGARDGKPYLHSQMLAVKAEYRDQGLGRRLKLVQRSEALARGFNRMEWSFDPLEIKNAYLNLEKLGAIARRYRFNQYGITSSALQGGLPTDRLVAEWWLGSKRVETVLGGGQPAPFEVAARIRIPAEIQAWKQSAATRDRALSVQTEVGRQFSAAFEHGLAALGYECDRQGNGQFLLGAWDEA